MRLLGEGDEGDQVEERHQRVLSGRSTMTHDPQGTLCGCASHWCLLCARNWPTQHLAWLSDPPVVLDGLPIVVGELFNAEVC